MSSAQGQPDESHGQADATSARPPLAGEVEPATPTAAGEQHNARIGIIEMRRGRHPGEMYARVIRPYFPGFARGGSYLVAREELLKPRQGLGRLWYTLRRLLIGHPIATALEAEERLSKLKALAIFSSAALTSVAYGPEEIMKVLALAGIGALGLTLPVAAAITLLLAIVVTSYQQTILAYPSGGGSYIVARENLGDLFGLLAAAALLIDYILTVTVSVATGITALTSAFPVTFQYKLEIIVFAVVLVMLANLRGIRESGTIVAIPAYAFMAAVMGTIAVGLAYVVGGTPVEYTPPANPALGTQALTAFLLLAAFAQGCTSLTGVEAVANGVQAFKPPEPRNAQITLIWTGLLLGIMLLGIGYLASLVGIVPDPTEQESILSQIARSFVGRSMFYYVLQFTTMLLLVLAANTSFAGFPRLAAILADDGYLPRQFSFRGDRLSYSTGVVFLAVAAIGLLLLFRGSIDRLIPLFAIGVFTAITLSQAGMVERWRRLKTPGWQARAAVNGFGAIVTGVVVLIIATTKFVHGAWMVILMIPVFVLLMKAVSDHYSTLARKLATRPGETVLPVHREPAVIVPISRISRPNLAALSFARSISPDVTAVHIANSQEEIAEFRHRWDEQKIEAKLVIVDSPYRALLPPLLAFVDAVDQRDKTRPITVVIASVVPDHWWQGLLHNQVALRLRLALLSRPNTIVIDMPYFPDHPYEGEIRPTET